MVLFVGWKIGREKVFDELTNGGSLKLSPWVLKTIFFLIRFVAPAGPAGHSHFPNTRIVYEKNVTRRLYNRLFRLLHHAGPAPSWL